jgi:hypothetical protein
MVDDAKRRTRQHLDTLLRRLAAGEDALLWALHEGYDWAHEEPTLTSIEPVEDPKLPEGVG